MSTRQRETQHKPATPVQTTDTTSTEQENDSSLEGASTAWAFSGASAPSENPNKRLNQLPTTHRQQVLLQMQRQHGNAYVQRMMSGTNDIQRYNPTTAAVGTGQKHTLKTPKHEIKLGHTVPRVPITLKSVAFSADISIDISPAQEDQKSATQARAGLTGGGAPVVGGVQGEVLQKWQTWQDTAVGDIELNSKAGGEVTTDGGKIGVDIIGLKVGRLSFALKFNILSYSADKSKLEFATLTFEEALTAYKYEETAPNGDKIKVEVKPKAEWKFEPNYAEIGKWLVQKFGEQAMVELGLAGAFAVGAIGTIAAAIVTASLGGEVRERVDGAVKGTNDFCWAYEATLKGLNMNFDTPFGAKGKAAAQDFMSKSSVPREVLIEKAQERSIRGEAFGKGWPVVKEAMLKSYRDEHYVEWFVYGEDGPGYRILKRLLDAPQHLNF